MPRSHASPLDGTERLLIDGTNLLHALRRGAPAAPPATLVGRLRGVVEMPIRIELILDGPPDPGLGATRIASGVTVRYSGRQSADAVLARLAAEASQPATILIVTDDVELRHAVTALGARTASAHWLISRLDRSRLVAPAVGRPRSPAPPDAAAASAPIAPPRPPRSPSGRPSGGRTAPSGGKAPGSGGDAPSGSPAAPSDGQAAGEPATIPVKPEDAGADRPGWQPGRGATKKRGNPRKAPRTRHPG